MFAVLLKAIFQLRSHDARDVIEAEHWIRDHETTAWPFSFPNICEVLGIESTSLARALLTWRDRPADAAQRAPLRQIRSARTRVAPLRERTRRAMKANGSPTPRFEFDDDRSYFIARLPVHRAARCRSRQACATANISRKPT